MTAKISIEFTPDAPPGEVSSRSFGRMFRLIRIGDLVDIRFVHEGTERTYTAYVGARPEAVRGVAEFESEFVESVESLQRKAMVWLRGHLAECVSALDEALTG